MAATVPALQGSQWKLCISHLLHHMCVAIIIIIMLQMGHFSLHGWLLFQYFLLSSPNMQCACASTPPQQWTRCQIKSAEGARRVSVTYWFCGFIQPQPDSRPRQPPPLPISQWATAGLVSDDCSTCYIDKFHPNSDKTDQHVTAAKAIPRISQVNKMDLSLCWFSQNHSCDFFPLFSEACCWIFVAGKKEFRVIDREQKHAEERNWSHWIIWYVCSAFFAFLAITIFPSRTLSEAIISMHESSISQCSWGSSHPASSYLVSWMKHS